MIVHETSTLEDSSHTHRQVQLDVHALEGLFAKTLRALTNKRIEVVARYIVRQSFFFTRDMCNRRVLSMLLKAKAKIVYSCLRSQDLFQNNPTPRNIAVIPESQTKQAKYQ